MVASPVLLTVSDAIWQTRGLDPAWAAVLKILGAVTLVAIFGVARQVREQTPLASLIGLSLCVIGLMNVACISALRLASWEISGIGLDPVAMQAIQR